MRKYTVRKCPSCKRTFTHHAGYYAHIRNAHPEMPKWMRDGTEPPLKQPAKAVQPKQPLLNGADSDVESVIGLIREWVPSAITAVRQRISELQQEIEAENRKLEQLLALRLGGLGGNDADAVEAKDAA